MMNDTYVYYRVSTQKQDTERQKQAIEKYVKDNNITVTAVFEDHASGKNFERPQYQALKHTIKKGDTLIVKELDRFGRNYDEIKDEWRELTNNGILIVVVDNPLLSASGKSDLESKLISNLVFEIFSYTAQKEREKINQRVREGMNKAKIIGTRSGKPIGRPERKDTIPKEFEKYYKRWTHKEITGVEFAKLLGLSRMSLYRYIGTYEQINNIKRVG
jgi:DNA invertase Pin-like site-specific DNA recombinase